MHRIFRALLLGPNSTFNSFTELFKGEFHTRTEVEEGGLIQKATENYNNIVAAKIMDKYGP